MIFFDTFIQKVKSWQILKSAAIQVSEWSRMLEDKLGGELRAVKLNWFVVLITHTAKDLMQESESCLGLAVIYTKVLAVSLGDSHTHTRTALPIAESGCCM